MVRVNKIRGRLVEMEKSMDDLAGVLNVDRSTVYRKFKTPDESLSIVEVSRIAEYLELTKAETIDIFFNHDVANNATTEEAT